MSKARILLYTRSIAVGCLFLGRASGRPARGRCVCACGASHADQVEAFSDLTGSRPYLIHWRLAADPRLVSFAPQAADARISRRRAGKVMTIVGFTILGVGNIIGTAIIVTIPGYPDEIEGHEGRVLLDAGIGLGSLAIGLALGIPGIIKMVRTTDIENQALEVYSPGSTNVAARRWAGPEKAVRSHATGNA